MHNPIYSILTHSTKYSKWYIALVETAKQKCRYRITGEYYEKHHIIPKSLGGNDTSDNLVLLTAREHFIAHACLWKHFKAIGATFNERKMGKAFYMMTISSNGQQRYNSKLYEAARTLNTNAGAVRSATFKANLSKRYTGANSITALKINIYNNTGMLMFTTHGNFKSICKQHSLPFGALTKSYQTDCPINYKPGQSQTKATRTGNIVYQGWYAKIVKP